MIFQNKKIRLSKKKNKRKRINIKIKNNYYFLRACGINEIKLKIPETKIINT